MVRIIFNTLKDFSRCTVGNVDSHIKNMIVDEEKEIKIQWKNRGVIATMSRVYDDIIITTEKKE